jgi:hypothetical protein
MTYALQFRGQVAPLTDGFRKHGRSPGCALVTSLARTGPDVRYVWAEDEVEAVLESTLRFEDREAFSEEGTLHFAPGHALEVRGRGFLVGSPDPCLRQGTTVWEVLGGTGALAGASGWITSNLLLSETGDLTESQLGVIFRDATALTPPGAGTRDVPGASRCSPARPSSECPIQARARIQKEER